MVALVGPGVEQLGMTCRVEAAHMRERGRVVRGRLAMRALCRSLPRRLRCEPHHGGVVVGVCRVMHQAR
jgi:hypothetical protein